MEKSKRTAIELDMTTYERYYRFHHELSKKIGFNIGKGELTKKMMNYMMDKIELGEIDVLNMEEK